MAFCPLHDLKSRGICIDCATEPVEGTPRRALRCTTCKKLERHQAGESYRKRHPKRVKRKERERMADPVKHAAKVEYGRLYRQAQPQHVAEWKRRDYEKRREHYLEYHRKYREARREQIRDAARLRWHGELPTRTCLTCPTVLTGRPKKCTDCKQRERREARARISERIEAATHA